MTKEQMFTTCDKCSSKINFANENMYILYHKNKEDITVCDFCHFNFRNELKLCKYQCDDWDDQDEDEEEVCFQIYPVHQLKYFLKCRGLKTSGNKSELISRLECDITS